MSATVIWATGFKVVEGVVVEVLGERGWEPMVPMYQPAPCRLLPGIYLGSNHAV